MKYKAAIFDLDGVLVDTAEFHYRAWKRLADELGIAFDRQKNHRLRGVPRMRSLEIVMEDVRPQPVNLDELADRKNGYYVQMVRALTPADVLPGVVSFLEKLRGAGVKIGVASSSKNCRTVIERIGIGPLLDAMIGGDDYDHPKPHPDIFLKCAAAIGVAPAEAVVAEDAQAGIDAAVAGGFYAVGVGRDQGLTGARLVVSSVADIPLSLWI
jgi:beta-phosphoglucomutase